MVFIVKIMTIFQMALIGFNFYYNNREFMTTWQSSIIFGCPPNMVILGLFLTHTSNFHKIDNLNTGFYVFDIKYKVLGSLWNIFCSLKSIINKVRACQKNKTLSGHLIVNRPATTHTQKRGRKGGGLNPKIPTLKCQNPKIPS